MYWVHSLYLSIVTNLFHSLLYTFQCWSSLNLIHFLSLFFMIFLCFFKSSSYQGFLCLLVIVFVAAGAIYLMVLSFSLSWLAAILSVVLSRIGRLLNLLLNCVIALLVNFCTVLFSCIGLSFVCEVSNVMDHDLIYMVLLWVVHGMLEVWWLSPIYVLDFVLGCSHVVFKLKVAFVFRSVCASWSSLLLIWILRFPILLDLDV